jgi:hypothetical protein
MSGTAALILATVVVLAPGPGAVGSAEGAPGDAAEQAASQPAKNATMVRVVAPAGLGGPVSVTPLLHRIFSDAAIHFTPESPGTYDTDDVTHEDNGRVAIRTVELPIWGGAMGAIAMLTVRPVPDGELSVSDPWDRAGSVRVCPPGMPEIELVKSPRTGAPRSTRSTCPRCCRFSRAHARSRRS